MFLFFFLLVLLPLRFIQSGCVDRYRFQIPIRIDETDEAEENNKIHQFPSSSSSTTPENNTADIDNTNLTLGQQLYTELQEGERRAKQASQYKWYSAEVVDLLLGDVNEVKNPYIGKQALKSRNSNYQRKTAARKLSRKFSLVKRNKTFKTPMSKYNALLKKS